MIQVVMDAERRAAITFQLLYHNPDFYTLLTSRGNLRKSFKVLNFSQRNLPLIPKFSEIIFIFLVNLGANFHERLTGKLKESKYTLATRIKNHHLFSIANGMKHTFLELDPPEFMRPVR